MDFIENTPPSQIINAILSRLGHWHQIEFHAIGIQVIELSVGGVRAEIRVSEWFAGNRRFAAVARHGTMSDIDRTFIAHLNGILSEMR